MRNPVFITAAAVGLLQSSFVAAQTLTTLVNFDGANGREPVASLFAAASGKIYGTTRVGGTSNLGTVFSLNNGTFATEVSFSGGNGAFPPSSLIADAAGTLYGTTSSGGDLFGLIGSCSQGCGTVFSLNGGTLTTLANFRPSNGIVLLGSLKADASGRLHATAAFGGTSNAGTVFSVNEGTVTTLAHFDFNNGARPNGSLIADASGTLYGTTQFGGGGGVGAGTVFSLSPGGTLTTLTRFNGANGREPMGDLIADASIHYSAPQHRCGCSAAYREPRRQPPPG